jgi:hypothetical protein
MLLKKVQRFKGSRVQGFKGSRVQGYCHAERSRSGVGIVSQCFFVTLVPLWLKKVQGFQSFRVSGSRVQRFKGSRVQRDYFMFVIVKSELIINK